jgi:hypothetical protein
MNGMKKVHLHYTSGQGAPLSASKAAFQFAVKFAKIST